MELRDARIEDAEAVERVRIRGWQAAYRDVFPPAALDELPIDSTRWRTFLADPAGARTFVAVVDGAIVGFATIGPDRAGESVGELHGLYVEPGAWSRGIGSALLARAEAELAATWDEAVLWTLERVPRTRRFYELAGWRLDGGRASFDALGVVASTVRYRKRIERPA